VQELSSTLSITGQWSTDGRGVPLGHVLRWRNEAALPGRHVLGVELYALFARFDPREIEGSGVAVQRPDRADVQVYGALAGGRRVALEFGLLAGRSADGEGRPLSPWAAQLGLRLRPWPALETRVSAQVGVEADGPRWLRGEADGAQVFGELTATSLGVEGRQVWALGPRVSLEGRVQLLRVRGDHGARYVVKDAGRWLWLDELVRDDARLAPSIAFDALEASAVLRWEWRPGASVVAAWTHGTAGDAAWLKLTAYLVK
jgi:hypothetical protein